MNIYFKVASYKRKNPADALNPVESSSLVAGTTNPPSLREDRWWLLALEREQLRWSTNESETAARDLRTWKDAPICHLHQAVFSKCGLDPYLFLLLYFWHENFTRLLAFNHLIFQSYRNHFDVVSLSKFLSFSIIPTRLTEDWSFLLASQRVIFVVLLNFSYSCGFKRDQIFSFNV